MYLHSVMKNGTVSLELSIKSERSTKDKDEKVCTTKLAADKNDGVYVCVPWCGLSELCTAMYHMGYEAREEDMARMMRKALEMTAAAEGIELLP